MSREQSASYLQSGATIGIMGGGQLGRMLAMSAAELGYKAHIYSPEADVPAEEVAYSTIVAPYHDEAALERFASNVDVITVEFENIPVSTARYLSEKRLFCPSADILALCQHRGKEKAFVQECGVMTTRYRIVDNVESFVAAVQEIGVPCLAKSTMMGYDGKGQSMIHGMGQCADIWQQLGEVELIIEALVPFVAEASVIIGRDQQGEMVLFPVTHNIHKDGILHQSLVPAALPETSIMAMQSAAKNIAEKAKLCGLLAIEFFVLEDGDILVNEMAPRPHNSGHWTMDGCSISQFEQLIRICAGLPMRKAELYAPTVMTNLISSDIEQLPDWYADHACHVHLYGKKECRAGRKMGHVTRVALSTQPDDEV